jgi:hypothetical protein
MGWTWQQSRSHGIFAPPYPERPRHDEELMRIERCSITGFGGDGLHLHDTWCWNLRSSNVSCNRGHGLWFTGADGHITESWFTANTRCGVCSPGNSTFNFCNNRIEWNMEAGIRMHTAFHWILTNNTFASNRGPNIDLAPDHDLPDGIGGVDIAITSNLIRHGGSQELATEFMAAEMARNPSDEKHPERERCQVRLVRSSEIVISSNTFHGAWGANKSAGIVLGACRDIVITNNIYGGLRPRFVEDLGEHEGPIVVRHNLGTPEAASAPSVLPKVYIRQLEECPSPEEIPERLREEPLLQLRRGNSMPGADGTTPLSAAPQKTRALAEVRLGAADGSLLVWARVYDARNHADMETWECTSFEVYAMGLSDKHPRQLAIVPHGPDKPCTAQVRIRQGTPQPARDVTVRVRPLPVAGYELCAVIPLGELGLPPQTSRFRLELAAVATETHFAHHVTAFGTPRPFHNPAPDAWLATAVVGEDSLSYSTQNTGETASRSND